MQEKVNLYVEPIFMKKKKHDYKAWRKKREVIKMLRTVSPNFNMMLETYRFLCILHKVYMYSNEEPHPLVLIPVSGDSNAAFGYRGKNYMLKFFLRESDMNIYIRIERAGIPGMKGKKEDVTEISFRDGSYVIHNKYEEETFIFLIACMTEGIIDLVNYYYKNKKF